MRCIFTNRTIGMRSFSIGTNPTIGTNGPSVWRVVSVCVYWTCVDTSIVTTNMKFAWIFKSLRKQPILRDSTAGSPRNDVWEKTSAKNPYWWLVATQIWVVLLIGWSKFSTNQKPCPDLGGDASSLWNFCPRFSDVISREVAKCRLSSQTRFLNVHKIKSFFLACRPY